MDLGPVSIKRLKYFVRGCVAEKGEDGNGRGGGQEAGGGSILGCTCVALPTFFFPSGRIFATDPHLGASTPTLFLLHDIPSVLLLQLQPHIYSGSVPPCDGLFCTALTTERQSGGSSSGSFRDLNEVHHDSSSVAEV